MAWLRLAITYPLERRNDPEVVADIAARERQAKEFFRSRVVRRERVIGQDIQVTFLKVDLMAIFKEAKPSAIIDGKDIAPMKSDITGLRGIGGIMDNVRTKIRTKVDGIRTKGDEVVRRADDVANQAETVFNKMNAEISDAEDELNQIAGGNRPPD